MPGIREGWRWLFPSARIPANAVAAPAKAAPLWRPGTVGDGGEGIYNTFGNMQVGQSLSVRAARRLWCRSVPLLRLNNVADKRYALANGYTMPGRNLFVALQWSDPAP
jgi:hypothetical protein